MLNKTQWINTYNNYISFNKIYNETTDIESLIESCEWMKTLSHIEFNENIGQYVDTIYAEIINPLMLIIEKMSSKVSANYIRILTEDHHPMFDDDMVKDFFYEMLENGEVIFEYAGFDNEEDAIKGILSEQSIKISSLEEFYDFFIYFDKDMFNL